MNIQKYCTSKLISRTLRNLNTSSSNIEKYNLTRKCTLQLKLIKPAYEIPFRHKTETTKMLTKPRKSLKRTCEISYCVPMVVKGGRSSWTLAGT